LVSFSSSLPRGSPWADALSCLLGLPCPIWVRTAMREGLRVFLLGGSNGPFYGAEVGAVFDLLHMPPVGFEAKRSLFRKGQVRAPLDGDVIVIVKEDQFSQSEVAGQGGGLMGNAFHQVPVADDGVSKMVDDFVSRSIEGGSQERSAMAMPTALANPWPRGPVVVSTPGVSPYSGWPGFCFPTAES